MLLPSATSIKKRAEKLERQRKIRQSDIERKALISKWKNSLIPIDQRFDRLRHLKELKSRIKSDVTFSEKIIRSNGENLLNHDPTLSSDEIKYAVDLAREIVNSKKKEKLPTKEVTYLEVSRTTLIEKIRIFIRRE